VNIGIELELKKRALHNRGLLTICFFVRVFPHWLPGALLLSGQHRKMLISDMATVDVSHIISLSVSTALHKVLDDPADLLLFPHQPPVIHPSHICKAHLAAELHQQTHIAGVAVLGALRQSGELQGLHRSFEPVVHIVSPFECGDYEGRNTRFDGWYERKLWRS